MTKIVSASTKADYKIIADLATIIWTEHYMPIIGEQQITYMLDKFQSASAVESQIESGYQYFLLKDENTSVGYFSFEEREGVLFLSKLYVLSTARGKGFGKAALLFMEAKVKEKGLKKIQLTVNKYNSNSIKAYGKMGFKNVRELVQDIGNGYVMDDYVLEKEIR